MHARKSPRRGATFLVQYYTLVIFWQYGGKKKRSTLTGTELVFCITPSARMSRVNPGPPCKQRPPLPTTRIDFCPCVTHTTAPPVTRRKLGHTESTHPFIHEKKFGGAQSRTTPNYLNGAFLLRNLSIPLPVMLPRGRLHALAGWKHGPGMHILCIFPCLAPFRNEIRPNHGGSR